MFKRQFLQPPSQTEAAQNLMTLSRKSFHPLDDYVHHARTLTQESGLQGEKWFIASFLNSIPNFDYHRIVHDKDPDTFEDAIEIVLRYMHTSKKDHNKLEPIGQNPGSFSGKHWSKH